LIPSTELRTSIDLIIDYFSAAKKTFTTILTRLRRGKPVSAALRRGKPGVKTPQ